MLFRESETIELKEVVVDDIKKEIIAFANSYNRKKGGANDKLESVARMPQTQRGLQI